MAGVSCTAFDEGTAACARAQYRLTQDVQYLIINLLRDASSAEVKCPLRSIQDIYTFAEDGAEPFKDHVLDRVEAAGLDRDLLVMVCYAEDSGGSASCCLLMDNHKHRNVFLECLRMASVYALNYNEDIPVKQPGLNGVEANFPAIQDETTAGSLTELECGRPVEHQRNGLEEIEPNLTKEPELDTAEALRPQVPRLCGPEPRLNVQEDPRLLTKEELEGNCKEALSRDSLNLFNNEEGEGEFFERSKWADLVQAF